MVERVAAPTPDGTIVRLAADAPRARPPTRSRFGPAGPYRYYLATTVQPDASSEAIDGAELIHGSFRPTAGGGQVMRRRALIYAALALAVPLPALALSGQRRPGGASCRER